LMSQGGIGKREEATIFSGLPVRTDPRNERNERWMPSFFHPVGTNNPA
jgi:hypothetical protein